MVLEQVNILLSLLISHLLADFLFQSNKMAREKKRGVKSKYFYIHISIVGILTYLSLVLYKGWSVWSDAAIIMIIHAAIDLVKAKTSRDDIWSFILDQLMHILTILIYWLVITDNLNAQKIVESIFTSIQTSHLLVLTGYLLSAMPSGILIGYMTRKWQNEIEKYELLNNKEESNAISERELKGLSNAGKWIGILERFLVLTFILTNELRAIGFLLAAKSVFRFGDLKNGHDRKRTEYILIGTLLSFSFSILIGLAIRYCIR